MKYILDGKTPVKCDDDVLWAKNFRVDNRHVAVTENGDVRVSTVFLGLDHSYDGGRPLLFETMIFGGEHDQEMWRYFTWDEAETGHKEACILAGV